MGFYETGQLLPSEQQGLSTGIASDHDVDPPPFDVVPYIAPLLIALALVAFLAFARRRVRWLCVRGMTVAREYFWMAARWLRMVDDPKI